MDERHIHLAFSRFQEEAGLQEVRVLPEGGARQSWSLISGPALGPEGCALCVSESAIVWQQDALSSEDGSLRLSMSF